MKTKKLLRYISALLLTGFGLLTLFLSTSIILDLFDIRVKEGNYVLFIVWTNFFCSILYLISVYGFLKMKSWTKLFLGLASIILIISFMSFLVYINTGGIYETKTIGAMIFRVVLTIALTLVAFLTIENNKPTKITP